MWYKKIKPLQIQTEGGLIEAINIKLVKCYGPSVISVTVTKGGHPRGSRLYGTSGTIR